MINFSNVSRQLDENPRVLPNPPGFEGRNRRGGAGQQGRNTEGEVINFMKDHINPHGNYKVAGGNNIKTDFYDDAETGDPRDNTNYSVKMTKNPDLPVKVQQSGFQNGARGAMNKLLIPGSKDDDLMGARLDTPEGKQKFIQSIRGNPLMQAFVMKFGANIRGENGNNLNLSNFKNVFANGMNQQELSQEQLRMLERINESQRTKENPFLRTEEMQDMFPDHFKQLMKHLDDNKAGIFDQMVRKHDSRYPSKSYQYGDPSPVDKMIHVRNERGSSGLNGKIDIRDMSDEEVEEAMKTVDWYDNGDNLYLANQETDDINKRLLDVYSMTENADSWELLPGRGDRAMGNRKGAQPGLLKSTMGIDEEMLEEVFGPAEFSANIRPSARGGSLLSNIINNIKEEVMNFNKLHFSESLEVEQSSSEKASMSGEKQNAGTRRQRQKDQMAQKSPISKSGVVYASEEYFRQIREGSRLCRAQDKARQDWRQDLEEHRGSPANEASDEGTHPYIRLMPKTNQIPQKKKEEKMKEIQSEQVSFEDALGSLIESEKPFDPDARRKQRGAMLKKLAQNAPKDTRTDAQKMADATGPRKGSNFRGD
jgi:hypothetical protein